MEKININTYNWSVSFICKLIEKKILILKQNTIKYTKEEQKEFLNLLRFNSIKPTIYFQKDNSGRMYVLFDKCSDKLYTILKSENLDSDFLLNAFHFNVNVLINPTTEQIELTNKYS